MPIIPPSYQELVQKARRELEKIGFNNWLEGSAIGAIVRVIAAYLSDIWTALRDLEQQTSPSTARGIYLDRLGEMFGVVRLPPQAASTIGRGPSVKFTNNGATTVNIPLGTRVWNPNDPDIAFFTTESVSISAGQEAFVNVVAGTTGEDYNVAANVLTAHNGGMGQVSSTNVRPIGGGTFFESDDSYRFRISQALQARNGATEIAIRQALLRVPGVRDVLVHSGARGNGSVDVIVVPIDRYASEDLMAAARTAVAEVVAAGISWRVSSPVVVRIDVRIQLRLAGSTQLQDVRSQVETSVRALVDNLRVNDGNGGHELIYNELVSRVQDAHPDIVDSAIDIFVQGTPSLQTNVIPNPGERLVSGSVSVV